MKQILLVGLGGLVGSVGRCQAQGLPLRYTSAEWLDLSPHQLGKSVVPLHPGRRRNP